MKGRSCKGFLSTQDKFMSGNFGMKDQVLALEWVRDNIGQFSGSPSKVVIFGSNFGGTSVQYHMLSPMSRGERDIEECFLFISRLMIFNNVCVQCFQNKCYNQCDRSI